LHEEIIVRCVSLLV